jgi:peptide/nickel transport system substrate-binding protein
LNSKWFAFFGVAFLAAALIACGGEKAAAPGAAGDSGKPVTGGTLTLAMARDATTFDPIASQDVYSAMILNNVVEALFEVDKAGNVVGKLVEKSENPQPNVYVWTLRKGVKFHDGSEFNAQAVKFNLERHTKNEKSVRYSDVKDIESIETPDAFTVRITLKTAFRPFTSKFTGGAGFMLNPKAVETLGDTLQRDLTNAGTGPFKFVQWQKDTQIVLEKNPSYWGKDANGVQLPYLDKLVFKPFPDENVRLTNLKTGEVDVLIGNPPDKDTKDLRSDANLKVQEIAGLGFSFISFNTSREPFSSVNLRRAVSYAIDREQIRKTVFFDNGKVLDAPIPEGLTFWYQKEASYHPYLKPDPAKVRSELAAAGKASGFKFSFQISNASPVLQQTAELIKDQLKAYGIEMEIQLIEFATVVANGNAGNYDALGLGWSGGIDPDGNFYSLFYTKAGFNLSKISDATFDKAMDEGRQLTDPAKAKEAYDRATKAFLDLQPFIIYYNAPQISTVRKNVQNYPQTYNGYWGTVDLKTVWKSQ